MQNRSVNTIARTLIQTVVRQKLTAIKNDPERSLVDMGLNFAGGSEQQHILQLAQQTLQDESSAYYRIIYDMALHINTDHLLGFGMNFGYNSLTASSRAKSWASTPICCWRRSCPSGCFRCCKAKRTAPSLSLPARRS